jgi:serine/threonine-protein kinase
MASAGSVGLSLPSYVNEAGRDRLFYAAVAIGGLWATMAFVTNVILQSTTRANLYIAICGVTASFGIAFLLKRLSTPAAVALGFVYQVALCFVVTLNEIYSSTLPYGNAVSWACVIILFFPALLPTNPKTTIITALVAATMGPAGYALSYYVLGAEFPDEASYFVMRFMPLYACAILAVVPASVIHRLGRDVKKARQLGAYELVKQLGQGGMGEVWLARHRMLARPAAIKLIRPDRGDLGAMTSRFETEAQATASLESAHTVKLFDYGVSRDGAFYYVMELLRGIDLNDLVAKYGPLKPARAFAIMIQACESLEEAHRAKMIHRDIKPSNIYLASHGIRFDYVKVLDFGLVKIDKPIRMVIEGEDGSGSGSGSGVDPTATGVGHVVGTPAFIAPEMAQGKQDIDARADVYCLGCVLYWLLTGQLVFMGKTPRDMAVSHCFEDPMEPSMRTEQRISDDVDDLVLKCLAKKPGDRPQSAKELAQLLRDCELEDTWTEADAEAWWREHLPDMVDGGEPEKSEAHMSTMFVEPVDE